MPAIEQRWMSSLASYDIKLIYRPGKSNTNADALSRKEDNLSEIINIIKADITISELYLELQTELQMKHQI